MAKGRRVIEQVVSRYHRAIEKKDLEGTLSCLSRQYFRVGHGPGQTTDPSRWTVGKLPTKAALRKWFSETSYKNKLEFLHSEINGDMGIAVVRETGKVTAPGDKGYSWREIVNVWCLSKVKGTWKIVSSIHYVT